MAPRGSTVYRDDVEVCLDFATSPHSARRKKVVMREITPEGSPAKPNKKRRKNIPSSTELPPNPDSGTTASTKPETQSPERPLEYDDTLGNGFDSGTPEPAYHETLLDPPTGKKSQSKTTHEYMDEWLKVHRDSYLAAILESEGRCVPACEVCGVERVDVRCLDCMCIPRMCRSCCRTSHRLTPLHRIEAWIEKRWQPSWLWQVGSIVCLGHSGSPCPYYRRSRAALEEMMIRLTSLDSGEMEGFPQDPSYGASPKKGEVGGGLMMTVVHTNGFHQLPVFPCFCSDAQEIHIQLLKAGLYPSTSADTQTVFTFELLKHFHLSTVDSHISAEQYCGLLRRLTNYTFPSEAFDRRRELTRVWQQYGHLTDLKRNGFGIVAFQVGTPKDGELALFCAVCPQPGLNLPSNWRELDDQWRFWRYLTADGNFVLDHLEVLGPDAAVWLTNGAHYFAETNRFGRFLETVTEKKETPTCNQLRAIADKNKTKKGYDSTGIVATACTRHGCFCPSSVVDMQKGEKQANADYSISQAAATTKAFDTLGLMLAYDINCQYWVHFRKRFENEFLKGSIPPEAAILFLIGLFHVHGHKEECLPRFAPTFAPGAGMAAAEILESLWAGLIGAAGMTRNMTVAHRISVLNFCMADSNWKKFLGMINWLNKQYKLAKRGLAAAEKDFDRLNNDEVCSETQREEWESLMADAHSRRLAGDVTAMDVYKTSPFEVEGQNEVQVRLMSEELQAVGRRGVAEWIASGIHIQEEQLNLRAFIKSKRGDQKIGAASIETERRRAVLMKKLEKYYEDGGNLFDGLDVASLVAEEVVERNLCVCEDPINFATDSRKKGKGKTKPDLQVEHIKVPLPSTVVDLPANWLQEETKEEELRVAQAHEALEALRGHIAHKSYLYRSNKKLANGKRGRKSRYGLINSVEAALRLEARRYDLARWALFRLKVLPKYPELEELTSKDTKAILSVWDPNAEGQRNAELSWIWKVRSSSDPEEADKYVKDLYRVNWIRACSRRDRWKEELTLLQSEMEWYIRFCKTRRDDALGWALNGVTEGHKAYAYRQADMWERQGRFAKTQFRKKSGIIVEVAFGDEGQGESTGAPSQGEARPTGEPKF